jgi:pimeloyl-ACP methyl ester carboxylesterase
MIDKTEECNLIVRDQRLAATRVYPDPPCAPSVLSLHGLGANATRHRIRYLLDHLAQHGIASVCFDFSGNGDSTGILEQSCLRRRRDEALAAAALLGPQEPAALIGTSMGAHLAAWIAPLLHPRGLIFFCPAAYPQEAADLRFDSQFARPGAYPNSPAFAGLSEFTGQLLIVAARRDPVIPPEVIDRYVDSAPQARTKRVIWLDDCDHRVHPWLEEHGAPRAQVVQAVLETLA